jgi:hypothetical protein
LKALTPLKAIRSKCIDCSGGELGEVRNCQLKDCELFTLRMGKGSRATLKKIRAYCLWCCIGQKQEVKLCPSVSCTLWSYRFGKRPQKSLLLSKIGTTEGISDNNLSEAANVS